MLLFSQHFGNTCFSRIYSRGSVHLSLLEETSNLSLSAKTVYFVEADFILTDKIFSQQKNKITFPSRTLLQIINKLNSNGSFPTKILSDFCFNPNWASKALKIKPEASPIKRTGPCNSRSGKRGRRHLEPPSEVESCSCTPAFCWTLTLRRSEWQQGLTMLWCASVQSYIPKLTARQRSSPVPTSHLKLWRLSSIIIYLQNVPIIQKKIITST